MKSSVLRKKGSVRRERRIFFSLSLLLLLLACTPAIAQEVWDSAAIITAMRARSEAVNGFHAQIEATTTPGPDWQSYHRMQVEHNRLVCEFHKVPDRVVENLPRQPRPRTDQFDFRLTRDGGLRIEQVSVAGAGLEPTWIACFNGKSWNRFLPNRQPHPYLIRSKTIEAPPLSLAAGTGSPLSLPERALLLPRDGVSETLLEFLQSSESASRILAVTPRSDPVNGKVVTVEISHPLERESPRFGTRYLRVLVTFSLEYGMAPVELEIEEIHKDDHSYKRTPQQPTLISRWVDFREIMPQLWLPEEFQVEVVKYLVMPPDKGKFVPEFRSGKAVLHNGRHIIDLSRTLEHRFIFERTSYEITYLEVPLQLVGDLCSTEYPAGTIIDDRESDDVYQVVGLPGGKADVRLLERDGLPQSELQPNPAPRRWTPFSILLALHVVAAFAFIVWIVYRRRYAPK